MPARPRPRPKSGRLAAHSLGLGLGLGAGLGGQSSTRSATTYDDSRMWETLDRVQVLGGRGVGHNGYGDRSILGILRAGGLWLIIDVSTHCRGLKTGVYFSPALMTGGRLDASL